MNSNLTINYLKPTENKQIIYLNKDLTSWVKFLKIEPPFGLTMNEFEDLWALKPKDKLKIKICNKIIECPRFSTSFWKPYHFSGLNHEVDLNIPDRLNTLMNDCKLINSDLNQS